MSAVPSMSDLIRIVESAARPRLSMTPADRAERATRLGYTVDGYHGTSRNFAAFNHHAKAHFGFHFGSTPAAAEQKLKMDRDEKKSAVYRGAKAAALYEPDERDDAMHKLRRMRDDINRQLYQVKMTIEARRAPVDDQSLLAALERNDEPEIARLLTIGHPVPTDQETSRIRQLEDRLAEVEQRMSGYYARARPGERIIPVKLLLRNPIRMRDTNWGVAERIADDNRDLRLPRHSLAAIQRELQRRGHDGVVYRNEVEDVGADSYIVFSPNQIRSRHARFDPTKADSDNMMESAVLRHGPVRRSTEIVAAFHPFAALVHG